jgi:hypothetical protein
MSRGVQLLLLLGGFTLVACEGEAPAPSPGGPSVGGGGSGRVQAGAGGAGGGGGAVGGTTGGAAGAGGSAGEVTGSGGSPLSVDGGGLPGDGPPAPPAGVAVVEALKGAHVYFLGTMDNKRRAFAEVDFPAASGAGRKISLRLRLRCPAPGGCDIWDRWAYVGVVRGTAPNETVTEIMRFATPFRLTADWTADVSALSPMLSGKVKLVTFIDTWVGPGHPQGAGWLVDATFTFTPSPADRVPVEVIPLWDVASVEVGDPAKPVAAALPARMAAIPADAVAVELRSFITGHGQGNLQNCAEFCPKNHAYSVAGMSFSRSVWRTDCRTTAVPNQPGTWTASRAGWCPGALVEPWVVDVTAVAKAGATVPVGYAPESYVNSCRPDAPVCGGCALGMSCAYNDGNHTAPNYVHSALLVVYKAAAP